MGADGAIAIVSSVCGVVTAVISNPWGGRRWQRVVVDELTDEPLSHADSVHIEQIRERISELREEADAELNPHSVSRTSR